MRLKPLFLPRSLYNMSSLWLKTYHTPSAREVQVNIAFPNQFVLDCQQQLLPDWNVDISYLILVLQQSVVSLEQHSDRAVIEKDYLRAKFISIGCNLILKLQDRGYQSDLFDPRTGYPFFTRSGLALDDNAVVKAILNYPVTSSGQCSLITHPVWGNNVYPSTIATSAPLKAIVSSLSSTIADFD